MSRRIRVSSRALGPRRYVYVHIYDTLDEMRRVAERYNGELHPDSLGVTQGGWVVEDDGDRHAHVLVRLCRTELGTRIVSHEVHHAATAIYGEEIGKKRIATLAHLNQHNEPFAHLFSDLMYRLVDRLYALGYYDKVAA